MDWLFWLKIAYLAAFLLVLYGSVRTYLKSERTICWQPEHQMTDHRGDAVTDLHQFFLPPPRAIGRVVSAATSLVRSTWFDRAVRSVIFGIAGGASAWYAFYLFDCDFGWINEAGIAATALMFVASPTMQPTQSCTYIGTDGIQFHEVMGGERRQFRVRSITVNYDDLIDLTVLGHRAFGWFPTRYFWTRASQHCLEMNWSMTMPDAFWKRVNERFNHHLWSRSLLELAVIKNSDSLRDDLAESPSGLRIHVDANLVSDPHWMDPCVLTDVPPIGEQQRWYIGRLVFMETGLCYDEGFYLADGSCVKRSLCTWLQPDDIEFADDDNVKLTIQTADGTIRLPSVMVPQSQLLLRLMSSDIWTDGLESQIEREVNQDRVRLLNSDWLHDENRPYWTVIPAHRYCIWQAAALLQLEVDAELLSRLAAESDTLRESSRPAWSDWLLEFGGEPARDATFARGLAPTAINRDIIDSEFADFESLIGIENVEKIAEDSSRTA